MTFLRHARHHAVLLAASVIAGVAAGASIASAAPSAVETAPGRLLFATDGGVVHDNVDARGEGFPIVLPDRSVLVVGTSGSAGSVPRVAITKVTASGAIDGTWGDRGTRDVPVGLYLLQALRQPDGRLLLVGTSRVGAAPGEGPAPLQVVRLLADGGLDATFGTGGIATTAVGIGCGGCTTAALGPDGSIVLVGATGTFPTDPTPTTVPDIHWALTRLTADGRADTSFGTNGVATIPDVRASGFNVAVLPGGQIVTEGQTGGSGSTDGVSMLLARLTASGAMDPAFGGGAPVRTPLFSGFAMLARDDGSVVVAGSQPSMLQPPFTPGRRLVAAYTPAGAPDGAFATGGVAQLEGDLDVVQLLPGAAGALTVVATPGFSFQPGARAVPATFYVGRWGAAGPPTNAPPLRTITVPFGGGGSSFVVSIRPRPLPPLGQNSFTGRYLTPRADGSFLAVGGVTVTQPTGEGTGYSIGRTALAALTPALTLDPRFGGPAAPLRAAIILSRQRARTAYTRHGVRVRLRSSAPGLWRVKIRTRDGTRVLAQSVLPVFGTTTRILPVELTRTGNRWLRGHRRVRVRVSTTARDLFGALTTTSAVGTLR